MLQVAALFWIRLWMWLTCSKWDAIFQRKNHTNFVSHEPNAKNPCKLDNCVSFVSNSRWDWGGGGRGFESNCNRMTFAHTFASDYRHLTAIKLCSEFVMERGICIKCAEYRWNWAEKSQHLLLLQPHSHKTKCLILKSAEQQQRHREKKNRNDNAYQSKQLIGKARTNNSAKRLATGVRKRAEHFAKKQTIHGFKKPMCVSCRRKVPKWKTI